MPLEVFFADSAYHVFVEGVLGGLIAAGVYAWRHDRAPATARV